VTACSEDEKLILDVNCTNCDAVLKAEAPKFEMPPHGLPEASCMGSKMPGTPINLVHGSTVTPRVVVKS
jgi:hypothetical protein